MKTLIPVTFVCAGLVACGSNPAPGSGSSTSSPVSSDNSGMPGGGGDDNGGGDHKGGGDNGGDHGGGDRGCDLECPDGLVGGHITVDLSKKDQEVKLDGDGKVKLTNASTPVTKTDWDSDGTDIDLIIVHDGKTCDRVKLPHDHDNKGTVVWDGMDPSITADSVVRAPVRELAFCFFPKDGKTW